ncbi:MAG: tRNA (adenosine(37)-N6)-dimethylallyltransferase MiaA [Candidatus Sungbacteria bacterium]|nr:tRNA (adenosine(37)-N6)-dimethylallyltransferase MiaA [Candidatus Sungbacteria bacterium]
MVQNSPARTLQHQKLIVIVGPTASGKSELAVKIARKYNGEIISADSRQVYRGLDIGTAKVAGIWRNGVFIYKKIPHHCIDFVSPRKIYSVAEFQQCAAHAINDIAQQEKTPILAGGTGLWIDAVVYDWSIPHVLPNPKLRARLEKKSATQLLAMLKKLDPKRAKTVEQKNPRRLIRAIEIASAIGHVPRLVKHSVFNTLWIGLNPAPVILGKRIKTRARKMIGAGLIAEIKKLRASGVTKKRISEFGFEYRAGLAYLDDRLSQAGLAERLAIETHQYAKRQMTWFKRNPNIIWNPSTREMQKYIAEFLQ